MAKKKASKQATQKSARPSNSFSVLNQLQEPDSPASLSSSSRSQTSGDEDRQCPPPSSDQLQEPVSPQLSSDSLSDTEGDEDTSSSSSVEESVEELASRSGLLKENRKTTFGLQLSHFKDQPEQVVLNQKDIDDVQTAWGFCLVGYVAGRFPGKEALLKLCTSWNVAYKFFTHQSGWLVFKFKTEEDRFKVLQGGPYFVFGRPLILKNMPSYFEFDNMELKQVPVWVKLPGLPLECWNPKALGKITSKVGIPVSTDGMTATKEQLSYARVLVEVDASVPLVRSVPIALPNGKTRNQQIVFEYEPKFCSTCSAFGHMAGNCGSAKSDVSPKNQPLDQGIKAKPSGMAPTTQPVNLPTEAGLVHQHGGQKTGVISNAPLDARVGNPKPSMGTSLSVGVHCMDAASSGKASAKLPVAKLNEAGVVNQPLRRETGLTGRKIISGQMQQKNRGSVGTTEVQESAGATTRSKLKGKQAAAPSQAEPKSRWRGGTSNWPVEYAR